MASFAQMRLGFIERALGWVDGVARLRGRNPNLPGHLSTGLAGEDAAFFCLRRKGYTVVARRWFSGELPGDIDLIAWQGSLLCFVEVKTRTARDAPRAVRRRCAEAPDPPPARPPLRAPVASARGAAAAI